ncbi:MAG: LysR family transcriptional regulator [Roseovarius sp.]
MPDVSHQTLRRLTYFAAIAQTGSIRGAARQLGLSVPVVSEALAELEAELNVTLANRTTRQFTLTDAGHRLHRTASDILALAQSVQDLAQDTQPLTGLLSLTLPVELATHWIGPKLAQFQALHPELRFAIDASDGVTQLKNSPHDMAIRTAYVRPGHSEPERPCLALRCVARHAPRITKADGALVLDNTTLIGPRPERGLLARDPRTGQDQRITFRSGLTVHNRGVAIALAEQGLGATLVLETSVAEACRTGALTRLLPDHDFGAISLSVILRDRLPSPAAKAFAAFLVPTSEADGTRALPQGAGS